MIKGEFRRKLLMLHRILGIATGLVVFVVSITGCCWVFRDEIEALYVDYDKVEPREEAFITPTEARKLAETVFPDKHVHGVLYGKPDEAVEVIFYEPEPEFYQSVFLDPYSGERLHVKDHFSGFFAFVLKGHVRLWLPPRIGEQVVSISVLLFMFVLVSGLILWWPKRKSNLKQRLSFQWKPGTRWKRKNFDLHSIVGFYVYSLALVLAFTGSVMAFNWFYYGVYKAVGGEKRAEFFVPDNIALPGEAADSVMPIDRLLPLLRKDSPDALSYEIHYPATDSASIYVEVAYSEGLYYDNDYRFFDRYTLEEIETTGIYGKYGDAGFADKLIRMNYDIHVGSIGGIVGKIIAFLASLVIASLPVTGTLLWYGRKYKKRRNSPKWASRTVAP
ncbi:PepSY-associated TM helix domain-containing protein [Pseudozobellia thermophila]|uniref:Uncharacterized iron-regulated membrane protein n=1 Tax=Pseudozobellia thermophila TaxID=192903 RepID=A0A1M6HUI5_9FLAO|nr:PepSY-associated TM helix domain-containing protein [Pseudozobellia thermophila]SHJ25830.1 Uncharacterized iron-regulated membrane protein [Pseudozobellia thermophila]